MDQIFGFGFCVSELEQSINCCNCAGDEANVCCGDLFGDFVANVFNVTATGEDGALSGVKARMLMFVDAVSGEVARLVVLGVSGVDVCTGIRCLDGVLDLSRESGLKTSLSSSEMSENESGSPSPSLVSGAVGVDKACGSCNPSFC